MAQAKPSKKPHDKTEIEVEPGAEKRLASILKKALNTPPKHTTGKAKEPDERRRRKR